MHWFSGVALMICVMLGLQPIVFDSTSMADTGRGGLWWQVRTFNVYSSKVPQLVAQQAEEPKNAYRYDPIGRRDPFDSLVKETPPVVEPGPVIEQTRPRGPLERFDLSALTLSGIVWGELGRRAIIRAPDGKGYFITVGMYMGQNGGQIVAIEDDRVVLREKHRDAKGDIFDKTLIIPLRPKEKQQG